MKEQRESLGVLFQKTNMKAEKSESISSIRIETKSDKPSVHYDISILLALLSQKYSSQYSSYVSNVMLTGVGDQRSEPRFHES